MTVQELLDLTDAMYDNAEKTSNKIKYMNIAIKALSPYFGYIVEDDTLVTVAGEDSYSFPSGIDDVSQIIVFAIGHKETPDSRYEYTQYSLSKSDESPMLQNSYYQIYDSSGNKKFVIYPEPTTSDLPIIIRYNKALTLFDEENTSFVSELDPLYHEMLAFYCVSMICSVGSSPDAIQSDYYMQKFENSLSKIWESKMRREIKHRKKSRDNPQWHRSRSYGRGF